MRTRIEMLEKQLVGYRELNAKLEGELQSSKTMPDMSEYSVTRADSSSLKNPFDICIYLVFHELPRNSLNL